MKFKFDKKFIKEIAIRTLGSFLTTFFFMILGYVVKAKWIFYTGSLVCLIMIWLHFLFVDREDDLKTKREARNMVIKSRSKKKVEDVEVPVPEEFMNFEVKENVPKMKVVKKTKKLDSVFDVDDLLDVKEDVAELDVDEDEETLESLKENAKEIRRNIEIAQAEAKEYFIKLQDLNSREVTLKKGICEREKVIIKLSDEMKELKEKAMQLNK